MANNETNRSGLPMLIEPTGPRPSLQRSETTAAFISQLLAERNRMAPQRARRRNSAEGAVGAYAAGARVAVKRMPMGYRTSIVA